jgi:hypothetical protein
VRDLGEVSGYVLDDVGVVSGPGYRVLALAHPLMIRDRCRFSKLIYEAWRSHRPGTLSYWTGARRTSEIAVHAKFAEHPTGVGRTHLLGTWLDKGMQE